MDDRDEMVRSFVGEWPTLDEVRSAFAHHHGPELKPLGKPCHDCAVECGFYSPMSAVLSLLPADEVRAHSLRWYCHNHPDRACAGNLNYQAAIAAQS